MDDLPANVKNVAARFWTYVSIGRDDDCWEWQGCTHRGYGVFYLRAGELLPGLAGQHVASRVALFLGTGRWPADLLACHTCDNPPCVNPAHLFSGTALDNNRDRHAKGGYANALPSDAGERARWLQAQGMTIVGIARELGISRPSVYKVLEDAR